MDIPPIRTDEEHHRALEEIEKLWNAPEGTPEGDRLDLLTERVWAYEEKRWPIVRTSS
jgi:HTH-type transcriptional regulator/antitoxin HigA